MTEPKNMLTRALSLVAFGALVACGPEALPPPPPPPPPPKSDRDAPSTASTDALGPRPTVTTPSAFAPPEPKVYNHASGMTVWLLERHTLPVVSIDLVVSAGARHDPDGKGGLAYATAAMLDEGAGARDALGIARDIDKLGASLHTGAYADYSYVQLTSLKKNLGPAVAIMSDVVAKPTFSPVEWKRVSDLWKNDLVQRQSEPSAVAGVVINAVVFGQKHYYAHPTEGTTKSAAKIGLDDLKKFYETEWRPQKATCVVVGDVSKDELDKILDASFAKWQRTNTPAPAPAAEPPTPSGRRVFIVDRADAPQSVIAVARKGVAASDAEAPPLVRVNSALGGSFTSRLNQDLREEHGWSYGAKSRFSFTQKPGVFVASAAVHTEHTGDALAAMLKHVNELTKSGLTDEEVQKSRMLARADLVEAFEGVDAAARRLARNAGIGLAPDHEGKASRIVDGATKDDLAKLAKKYVDPTDAAIVIVGPRAQIEPQLKKIGITDMKTLGPEGE